MPINVLDFENMIRGFMVNSINKAQPLLDTSVNSGYDDFFIKPMIEIYKPVIENINELDLITNLKNAKYISEEKLDEIGQNNYMIYREKGQKATTTLTLSFTNISEASNLVIPAGILFQTESGLKYETTERREFTPTELYTLYNPAKMAYDVDIEVQSIEVGSKYNISPNQITTCITKFSSNLLSVTNKSEVTNGIDKEGNEDYADRLRRSNLSRHLGTTPGYEQFMFDNFAEIEDIYIAGNGDEFMQRDIITIVDPITSQQTTMHIGGKIDIYVKGCIYDTEEITLELNSNYLTLGQKADKINLDSISVTNITDGTKIPVVSEKLTLNERMIIILDNNQVNGIHKSFDPSIVSNIAVSYNYTSDDLIVRSQTDTFSVGITKGWLETPLKDILYLQNANTLAYYNDTNYVVEKGGVIGTSRESSSITLVGLESVANGTPINIQYSVNRTLRDLRDIFEMSENRIVTTDIIIKEAQPVFVNLAFNVKVKPGFTYDDVAKSYLINSLNEFFNQCQLGAEVQESDIVGWIYNDDAVMNFLDYISLPFVSFYAADEPSDTMENRRDDTYLAVSNIQYPVLNKAVINATVISPV